MSWQAICLKGIVAYLIGFLPGRKPYRRHSGRIGGNSWSQLAGIFRIQRRQRGSDLACRFIDGGTGVIALMLLGVFAVVVALTRACIAGLYYKRGVISHPVAAAGQGPCTYYLFCDYRADDYNPA